MPCGEPGMPCAQAAGNCTSICETWTEADGPQSANLGIFTGHSYDPVRNVISFYYSGGDPVNAVPRATVLNLTCDRSAGILTTTDFILPSSHEPNQPYMYSIHAGTVLMCDSCSASTSCPQCAQSKYNCSWCLDTQSCLSSRRAASCGNRVKSPRLCPVTSAPVTQCDVHNSCELHEKMSTENESKGKERKGKEKDEM